MDLLATLGTEKEEQKNKFFTGLSLIWGGQLCLRVLHVPQKSMGKTNRKLVDVHPVPGQPCQNFTTHLPAIEHKTPQTPETCQGDLTSQTPKHLKNTENTILVCLKYSSGSLRGISGISCLCVGSVSACRGLSYAIPGRIILKPKRYHNNRIYGFFSLPNTLPQRVAWRTAAWNHPQWMTWHCRCPVDKHTSDNLLCTNS